MARKLKSPAFQWYPRDYIASTRVTMMTLVEEAIYRKLLDYCWLEGTISSDPKIIQRLVGKGSDLESIQEALKMFAVHPEDSSKMINDRLELERQKQADNSAKKSAAANKRWGKDKEAKKTPSSDADAMHVHSTCNADGMHVQCPTITSTITTTTTSNKKEVSANASPPKGGVWNPDIMQGRINKLFKRRDSTKWSGKEIKAYRKLEINDDDLELLESYYNPKTGSEYRRRDMLTLFNNWNGEIDRAQAWTDETKNRSNNENSKRTNQHGGTRRPDSSSTRNSTNAGEGINVPIL